eukprot:12411423-Ditylum_brightwellii.AAC.1
MDTPRYQQAPPLQNASIEKKAPSSGNFTSSQLICDIFDNISIVGVHLGSDEINTLTDSGANIDGTILGAFMRLLHPKKGVKCIPKKILQFTFSQWVD